MNNDNTNNNKTIPIMTIMISTVPIKYLTGKTTIPIITKTMKNDNDNNDNDNTSTKTTMTKQLPAIKQQE